MDLVNVNEENFKTTVLDSSLPILVDFWAEWCGPCRMVAPILDKLQKEYEGKIKIVKVNIDNNNGLAEKYEVMSIPTLIAFKDGKQFEMIVGAQGEARFKDLMDAVIASKS